MQDVIKAIIQRVDQHMTVAFIGLGNMGSGMAANILAKGMELKVWNRTPSKIQPLVERGAKPAATPREAVQGADVVVTSLMDDASVLDSLEGDNGILAGMAPGTTHVCVTTISPSFADQLLQIHHKHGTRFVCTPVLGRPDAAADGSLIALMAGDSDGIECAKPVVETFAHRIENLGGTPSHAATLKLCLNYSVISSIEMMSEIYTCAEKAGLPLNRLEGLFKMLFAFPVLQMYASKVKNRSFDDGGFRMTGGLKDVRLMVNAAASYGTSFDIGKLIEEKMQSAIRDGMENKDWSAIYEVSRKRAGLN